MVSDRMQGQEIRRFDRKQKIGRSKTIKVKMVD